MSAIITDQLRILSARSFVTDITSSGNSYYSFVGLPNSSDYDPYLPQEWDVLPPSPKDSFDEENNYWDTLIALKKILIDDVRQVVRKTTWTSGNIYDMYRHDISRTNLSKPSNSTNLYSSNYYVVNSDYRVYICLQNGTTPETPEGKPSLDEPTFVDLEPRSAGNSGDGYVWKYLYTIKPTEIIKFDSVNFIPVPPNWETSSDNALVRNNAADSGQIKTIVIKNRGSDLGTANRTYTNIPIKGDGNGGEATIIINNDSKVESVVISNGGNGYTYGTLDLEAAGVPKGTVDPIFDVIIPPQGGHGHDIYRELGATSVLVYSRIENDSENPDFITGNQISRVGIIRNPQSYDSNSLLTLEKASGVYALKLTGIGYSTAKFTPDTFIRQTISAGTTAFGRVISYDQVTGVLKYWQDRTLCGFTTTNSKDIDPTYGFKLNRFTATPGAGGSIEILGGTTSLEIQNTFGTNDNPGISTTINNRTYYLGQPFINGVSQPEVKKYSGSIIYVDNRPSITRSKNQKEDIKVILQF